MSEQDTAADGAAVDRDPDAPPQPDRVPDAAAWLIKNPKVHAELSEALAVLGKQCDDTGRKGSITLTIAVAPHKKIPHYAEITAKVDTGKVPAVKPENVIPTFIDDRGAFVDDDPGRNRDQYPLFTEDRPAGGAR